MYVNTKMIPIKLLQELGEEDEGEQQERVNSI
jgi:hypothetical protein